MRFTTPRSASILFVLTGVMLLMATTAFAPMATADEPGNNDDREYLLRFKFEPGQKVSYKVVYQMAHTSRKGQISETAFNNSTTMKHFRVDSVADNGHATLTSFIDSVKMEVRFNDGQPLEFNSESDDIVLPQFRAIAANVGIPLAETTFEPTGNVVSLIDLKASGQKSSSAEAETAASDDESATEETTEPEEIKTVAASTESVKAEPVKAEQPGDEATDAQAEEKPEKDLNAIGNYLLRFPEGPLKIDDRWSRTYEVPVKLDRKLQQTVRLRREFRLRSVKDGIATLTFKTSVITPVHNPVIATQLIQNTPTGTVEFDMERGLILKRVAKLDKTEFGFSGENSSMRAVSETVETLANVEMATDPVSTN